MIGKSSQDMSYAESIKPIRNQMRKFYYESLFDQLLMYLNAPEESKKIKKLQRRPWVAEKLILWLLTDSKNSYQYANRIASERDVINLINQAWDSNDLRTETDSIKSIELFFRQLMLPQAPYQIGLDSHAYALQLHMLGKLAPNSNLRKFLDLKAGMPIEEYFKIALLYWTNSMAKIPWFNKQFLQVLAPVFPLDQQAVFLNSITSNLDDLQNIARNRTIKQNEWFQPTYFYKTPCVWREGASVPFGRPTFRRYFEALIGDWLEESASIQLRQDHDNLIENYVAETLERGQYKFLREAEIKKLVPSGAKVVDFLLEDDGSVLLVEVKNKGLTEVVPATQIVSELQSRLKATIIKGQDQLAKTESELLKTEKYRKSVFYRVIVTINELWIPSAELLVDNHLRDKSTWLISVRELDMLVEVAGKTNTSIVSLVAQYDANQKEAKKFRHSIEGFLEKIGCMPKHIPSHLLSVLDLAIENIQAKLPKAAHQ